MVGTNLDASYMPFGRVPPIPCLFPFALWQTQPAYTAHLPPLYSTVSPLGRLAVRETAVADICCVRLARHCECMWSGGAHTERVQAHILRCAEKDLGAFGATMMRPTEIVLPYRPILANCQEEMRTLLRCNAFRPPCVAPKNTYPAISWAGH